MAAHSSGKDSNWLVDWLMHCLAKEAYRIVVDYVDAARSNSECLQAREAHDASGLRKTSMLLEDEHLYSVVQQGIASCFQ